jgi:hypothetical protein
MIKEVLIDVSIKNKIYACAKILSPCNLRKCTELHQHKLINNLFPSKNIHVLIAKKQKKQD